jgi:SAM-dependent methyltransferase
VLAIDISARRIELAKAACPQPNVTYQVRSLLDLDPKRDGLFDLAFSVNTIHCLGDHDLALAHVKSLLADGGHAVIIDIVDPGTWASRDWHIQDAFRDALASYRNRSRCHDAAADVLRLRLHPAWLEHVTTCIPLTRPLFHTAYNAVFPGAQFTDDLSPVVAAMHWTDPGQGASL